MTTGYSATPLAKKLGFQPGPRVATVGAPANYLELLAPLPEGIEIGGKVGKSTDVVHFFTTAEETRQGAHRHHRRHHPRGGAAHGAGGHQGVRGG